MRSMHTTSITTRIFSLFCVNLNITLFHISEVGDLNRPT